VMLGPRALVQIAGAGKRLDISMDETHVCVVDREGEVVRESKTASMAQAIADELAKAPSCRRIVFETGRMVPILFHGLSNSVCPWCASRAGRPTSYVRAVAEGMRKISYADIGSRQRSYIRLFGSISSSRSAFADVEDLLEERGIAVSYGTVRRWVNHFGPMIAAHLQAPSETACELAS
jgi:hypothetical protein